MAIKITAAPASSNDRFAFSEDHGVQAVGGLPGFTASLDVRANDGKAKAFPLCSLDNGQSADLASADPISTETGTRDRSLLGAAIWIRADGTVGYSTVPIGAMIEGLAVGETLQDSFLYATRQNSGALLWSTVTITITGTNDAPVALFDSAAVNEDALASGSVATNDRDVDKGAVLRFATNDAAPGFALSSDGGWVLDASNAAYQDLAAGETKTVTIGYTVTDQHGAAANAVLTVTVTGTNDRPVTSAVTVAVDEDGIIGGVLTASDADRGDSLSYAVVGDAPDGFTLAGNGAWSLDSAAADYYQALPAGETLTLVVNYMVTDQAGASVASTLTIALTGTNDVPVATAVAASVAEDALLRGQLAASDADGGTTLTYALIGDAPAGLSLGVDGSWSFDAADAAYQDLAADDTRTVSVGYSASDEEGASATSTLTITVTGTNDAPIASAVEASATEDTFIAGKLTASDADADAVLSFALMGDAPAGLSLGADGSWTFDAADVAYRSLGDGQMIDLIVAYEASDDAGARSQSTLTITVAGTNDAPVASASSTVLSEDATASGQLDGSDPDSGTVLSYSLVGTVPAGLTVAADGSWSYAPDSALQALNAGENVSYSVGYRVVDEQGGTADSTLTVTVNGANDTPLSAPSVVLTTENSNSSGRLTASDADAGAVLVFANLSNVNQAIWISADGSWQFFGDHSTFRNVAQGETRDFLTSYSVTDQFGAQTVSTVTTRVTGVNDAPVARTFNDSQSEGTVANGRLNIVDPDAGATLTYELIGAAPAGFALAADGRVTMDASGAAYDYLGSGSSIVVSASYRVTDEFGASSTGVINHTITGVNDRPALTGAALALPTQYQGQSFHISDAQLRQGWTDAEGDIISVADYPTVDHGTVTRSGSGFNILVEAGYVGPLTIRYVLSDNKGGVAFPTLIADVTDAARIGGSVTGATIEARYGNAGAPVAQGSLTIVDVGGDASFQTVAAPQTSAGGFGSFTLSASGAWDYRVDNNHAAVAGLNKGQSLSDSFTVYAADGTAQIITLSIAGATDWTSAAAFTDSGDSVDYDNNQGAAGTDNLNVSVTGSDLRDVFTGGSAAQTFDLLAGDDTVYAAGGDDIVYGGAGRDYVMGQIGNDVLDGGIGDDTLFGGAGADHVLGGDGNDSLYGGSGVDLVEGGAGRDFITGGFGADTLSGGAEGDAFIFTDVRDRGDTIVDYQSGLDTLMFAQIDANTSVAGDQAFAYSADGAAAYSLWTVQNGANLEIYADVDGNPNTAEFTLILLNTTSASWTL